MKITYINHSGFLVETENCYYVFDYYKGDMPRLDKSKEIVVFCSHFHQDHFNPKVFGILDDMGMNYQAVLAKDIGKKKYPAGVKITTAYHDQTYILDNGTQVSTLLSTDSGVAFIVKTSDGLIYHATATWPPCTVPRLTKSRALILMLHSFPLTQGRRYIMPTV